MNTYKLNLKVTVETNLSEEDLNKKIILDLFDADVSLNSDEENTLKITTKKTDRNTIKDKINSIIETLKSIKI